MDLEGIDKLLEYAGQMEKAEYITAYATLAIALMMRAEFDG